MSDTKENELTDITLCYMAMGVSIGDSPDKIEETYKALTEEYRKNLRSPDHAVREDAKNNIELIGELYEKIKGSITYQTMAKDYLKSSQRDADKAGIRKTAANVKVEKTRLMSCPNCKKIISKGLKVCPLCRKPVNTKAGKFIKQYFTITNTIISLIIVVIAITFVISIMFPDQFTGLMDSIAAEYRNLRLTR
jgi:hypothetical protein